MTSYKHRRRTAGTSLIEILVVIVVFLIGILAVVNVFPGGFQILRETKNLSVGNQLIRGEMERLKARLGQLPDMILPVNYSFTGSSVNITVDPNRTSFNIGPDAQALDSNGHFIQGGLDIGYWPYLAGSNVMRRIVGEGGPVPAPRPIGTEFGGLMILQFAPIVYNPAYPELFQIYGSDLIKRPGAPWNINVVRRNFEYFLEDSDEPTAAVYLPRNASEDIEYRLAMSAWIDNAGSARSEDYIDMVIPVPMGTGYWKVDLATLITGPGTFLGCEYDSLRVARAFHQVATFNASDPYEYKLLDPNLGLILFNPAGYNYYEPRGRGARVPLQARVSYDTYDWRILREEFRVPDGQPAQYRLPVTPLMVAGEIGTDGRIVSDYSFGEPATNDVSHFMLLDMDTGGTLLERSETLTDGGSPRRLVQVNPLLGVITFLDRDRDPSNGLQAEVLLPGAANAVTVDLAGRAVRALYSSKGQWAVQVMKAPSQFYLTYGLPGVAQYYVGSSNPNVGGSATRIYFPRIDAGKKVSIGEIWYLDGGGNQHVMSSQEFVIRNTPADPLGIPYVDITSADPNAVQFDLRDSSLGGRGFAVRRVKGASITVRALYNRSAFKLENTGDANADGATNLENFDKWMRTWKKITTESYLQRGETE